MINDNANDNANHNAREADVELYWTSADGSGRLPLGTYPSEEAATAAIPEATAELLAECATDQERDDIRAGRWSAIGPPREDFLMPTIRARLWRSASACHVHRRRPCC
jgi:hypothetical protein